MAWLETPGGVAAALNQYDRMQATDEEIEYARFLGVSPIAVVEERQDREEHARLVELYGDERFFDLDDEDVFCED